VTNLNLEKLLQDWKRASQYSKEGSGENNIVRTERLLHERYTEVSEKLKVNYGI